jgi:eukaryotic-like serine/threonine-protein kinase
MDRLAARVHEIFVAALDEAPEVRSDFVRNACAGDSHLMHEVCELLAVDEQWRTHRVNSVTPSAAIDGIDFKGTERFHVRRRIGVGGYGTVYEAWDCDRRARVAVKTLTHLEGTALYRFKNEFRAIADIAHENLVELYELVSTGSTWFFTMELVPGVDFLSWCWQLEDTSSPSPLELSFSERVPEVPSAKVSNVWCHALEHFVDGCDPGSENRPDFPDRNDIFSTLGPDTRDGGELDVERLREGMRQLASGLHALHSAGKLHRDVKPSNVLVRQDRRVVIVDFGLAANISLKSVAGTDLHHVMGTPAYMAPEQATGQRLTAAADWYAVGVMLFQALTGRLPFRGTAMQMLIDRQTLRPPPPSSVTNGVPADLDRLCVDLLQTRPEDRPPGAELLKRLGSNMPRAAALHARSAESHPLLGRDEELASLGDAFAHARRGTPRMVQVRGASGCGKTALVRHFLDQVASQEQAVVLAGRCYERESVPYKGFDSVIDALSRYMLRVPSAEGSALVPRDAFALARLFPVLQRVPAISRAPVRAVEIRDPQQLRIRAFAALRELLGRLADRRPVVIFIDDLQWGDADSAALLADLTAPPDPPALLVILGYRSEDEQTSPSLKALRQPRVGTHAPAESTVITVDALGQEDACALAAHLLSLSPNDALAQRIAHESGGNPFFVGELVRWLQADGTRPSIGVIRLEDVLRDRFTALSDHARRLLEVVAVSGRPITLDVAFGATTLEADHRVGALTSLRVAHLVRTTAADDIERIEPVHDRVREAIVTRMSERALRATHESIAFALAEADGAAVDVEALYVHFRQAGLVDRAAEHAVAAGQKAALALAFDRAVEHYRFAVEANQARGSDVAPLRVQLADALAHAGRGAEAAAEYVRAAEQATNSDVRLDLRRRAAEEYLKSGHIDRGLDAIQAVLRQIRMRLATSPRRALIGFLVLRLIIRIRGLNYRERAPHKLSAKQLARIDTCHSIASGLGVVDAIRAAQFQARSLILSLRAGEPRRLSRALSMEAAFHAAYGLRSYDRSMMLISRAEELAHRTRDPENIALAMASRAWTSFFSGKWVDARDYFDRAIVLLKEQTIGAQWILGTSQYFGMCALMYTGDFQTLRNRLPALVREAEDRGDLYLSTNLRIGYTNLWWLLADETSTASSMVAEAMARWSRRWFHLQHWYELQSLCQIDLYNGCASRAHERVEDRWPAFEASLALRVEVTASRARSLRGRIAIAVASTASDPEPFLRSAERDARWLHDRCNPWVDPLASLQLAGIARVRGQEDLARIGLEHAIAQFEATSTPLFAEVARRRLGETIGGDEGGVLVARADAWMNEHQIRRPERVAAVIAPGW